MKIGSKVEVGCRMFRVVKIDNKARLMREDVPGWVSYTAVRNQSCHSGWANETIDDDRVRELLGDMYDDALVDGEPLVKPFALAVGDRVKMGSDEYIIAQVDDLKVAAISCERGNRYKKPVEVASTSRITRDEAKGILSNWERVTKNGEALCI